MTQEIAQLKKIIQQRTEFITSDCDTFIMARVQKVEYAKWNTGGGNFLMAVGLFSVLNFLAKIHLHLVKPKLFTSDSDREDYLIKVEELKTANPEYKKFLNSLTKPKVNSVNETYAFEILVNTLPKYIDLGIIHYKIAPREIWKIYRNLLSHMAWPGSSIATNKYSSIQDKNIISIHSYIDVNSTTSFYRVGSIIQCNSDKLTVDLLKISDWLCRELDSNRYNEEDIGSTLKWLS